MPGFEWIGLEEHREVSSIFEKGGGVLFRHGFDGLRESSYKVREFESNFSEKFHGSPSLAVSSGTMALRVALAALQVGREDEVIVPSFTFVATAEAVIEAGATPVIAEIDETLTLDPIDVLRLITPKTKALIVVHMLGVPADMRKLAAICDEHDIFLIEDTAWGCGASLDSRLLGTFGNIGCFSFDHAKLLTTGEGGMLLFNRSPALYEKAAAWHDHGHENNPNVPRWEDTRSSSGFNGRMSELQGAVGLAQLKKIDTIIKSQRSIHSLMANSIGAISGVKVRPEPAGSQSSSDAFIFYVDDKNTAVRIKRELQSQIGLGTKILPEAVTWHFAKHWSHMKSLRIGMAESSGKPLLQSEGFLERCVSLPISRHLTKTKIIAMAEVIRRCVTIA